MSGSETADTEAIDRLTDSLGKFQSAIQKAAEEVPAMDDERLLAQNLAMLNSLPDGRAERLVSSWPDLRSIPFDGTKGSVGGPLPPLSHGFAYPRENQTHIIVIDKTTHRVRFEDETEAEVRIVIEPKSEIEPFKGPIPRPKDRK